MKSVLVNLMTNHPKIRRLIIVDAAKTCTKQQHVIDREPLPKSGKMGSSSKGTAHGQKLTEKDFIDCKASCHAVGTVQGQK